MLFKKLSFLSAGSGVSTTTRLREQAAADMELRMQADMATWYCHLGQHFVLLSRSAQTRSDRPRQLGSNVVTMEATVKYHRGLSSTTCCREAIALLYLT